MYISEKFPGPTVADITPDKVFSGKAVPDLDMDLLKDYYIKDISNKGVFIHTPEDIYKYKFGVHFDDRSEVWYNQSHFFKKLREISNKLGYKIGTHVDNKPKSVRYTPYGMGSYKLNNWTSSKDILNKYSDVRVVGIKFTIEF